MKTFTGITLSLFLSINVVAQQSAYFETTLYVVDAIGNIDSVVIGHDPEANSAFNPQFGEEDIESPFDSIFEVRAGHGLAYQGPDHDIVLSKRIIGGIEQHGYIKDYDCYAGREHIILFIHALHRPVTVYWDSSAFDTSWCTRGSIISSHDAHIATPLWYEWEWLLPATECMAESSSFMDSLSLNGGWYMGVIQPIQGSGLDTVHGIMVTPLYQESELADWCGDGVAHLDAIKGSTSIIAYPNPVAGMLYLNEPVASYVLFSVDGKVVKTGKDTSVFDMSGLQNGFYVLQVISIKSQTLLSMKIVKQ